MNERIKELCTKAYCMAFDEADDKNFLDHHMEKFAELLVQECAEICLEMAAKCAGLPGDGALAKDCAYWIKNDFGVEE
jgi:hypothetical protein